MKSHTDTPLNGLYNLGNRRLKSVKSLERNMQYLHLYINMSESKNQEIMRINFFFQK